MKTNIRTGAVGIGLSALLLVACQGSGSFAKLQESLAEIQAKQDTLLVKMGELETKIGQAPAARPGQDPKAKKPGGPLAELTYKVDVGDAHTKGPATAKVTIVEWSDFQCPFCSRVVPTMAELQKAYGDDIRIAFKHNAMAMHNRAKAAAIAAEAAGKQGKFWEMHDLLFANAKELTDENFVKWAGEIGIDVEKFAKDLADPAIAKKVDAHQLQGAKLGARGTPAFFVNGRYLSGAQPAEAFKKLIDEEMKKADALVAQGTPRDKVYEKVIEKGKTGV
jgi:protein-disulfide isomerase